MKTQALQRMIIKPMNTLFSTKIVFFALLLFFVQMSFGQYAPLSKDANVSVITCGTGNESYSLFGHTALRIQDASTGVDVVYNYGAFDFDTPNFVLKFIKGDLQYFAVAHPYADFISQYNYEQRAVFEQKLNIPYQLKQQLFDNLNTSLASADNHYTYKFIDKNCTSMVVDIINKTLNKKVIVKLQDTTSSYRTILYPYFDGHFYEKLGTSIIFGTKVDQEGTQLFLPFELMKSLKETRFQNRPLAQPATTLIDFKKEIPFSWWNNHYTFFVLLSFIVFINKKSVNLIYIGILAFIGLFFCFAWIYSLHGELAFNYNILLFNPSLLGLVYLHWTKNKKALYNVALFNLLCLFVYAVYISNKAHFLLVLPLIITSAIILFRIAKQNKKRIPLEQVY